MRQSWLATIRKGRPRSLSGNLKVATNLMILGLSIFNFYTLLVGSIPPFVQAAYFGCITIGLVMLFYSGGSEKQPNILEIILALLCFSAAIYITLRMDVWESRWPLADPLNSYELIIGAILIVIAFEASRRAVGIVVAGIGGLALMYTVFGHLIPGQFSHRPYELIEIIDQIVYTTNGIFSPAMIVIAKYVFVLVSFGVFLEKSNGGELFSNIGYALTRKMIGGSAKATIFASAAYASISGSGAADAATTGAFTIPMMKRSGFSARVAGAIEAAASTGGPFCPPIMGAVAFLMAELTGMKYKDIALIAIAPAALYYLILFFQIHFYSKINNVGNFNASEEIKSIRTTISSRGLFLIPISVLVYLILSGYSPGFAGIVGIISVILTSWLRRDTRLGLKEIVECIIESGKRIVPIGAICGAAGLIYGGVMVTGMGSKFGALITISTGSSFVGTLILTAIIAIILGMGLPVLGVYIIGVILLIPALTQVGISILGAHMFLIYYSIMGSITPPVAIVSYTVAPIANEDPVAISWSAVRFGITGFIIPLLFVLKPGILLQGNIIEIVLSLTTAFFGLLGLVALVEGFISHKEKIYLTLVILAIILLLFGRDLIVSLSGLPLLVLILLFKKKHKLKFRKIKIEIPGGD